MEKLVVGTALRDITSMLWERRVAVNVKHAHSENTRMLLDQTASRVHQVGTPMSLALHRIRSVSCAHRGRIPLCRDLGYARSVHRALIHHKWGHLRFPVFSVRWESTQHRRVWLSV